MPNSDAGFFASNETGRQSDRTTANARNVTPENQHPYSRNNREPISPREQDKSNEPQTPLTTPSSQWGHNTSTPPPINRVMASDSTLAEEMLNPEESDNESVRFTLDGDVLNPVPPAERSFEEEEEEEEISITFILPEKQLRHARGA